MNIKEIKSKKLYKEYSLEIPFEDIDKEINEKINNLIPTVSIPGFRKGKAPLSIVKKKYEDSVLNEVIQNVVSSKTNDLIKEKKLNLFRQPKINLKQFEKKGVEFIVKEPDLFKGKKVFISGGGDSALDWAIFFANQSNTSVGLVHRSESFRAHNDSVAKIYELKNEGKLKLYTNAEVVGLKGEKVLSEVEIEQKNGNNKVVKVDFWLPLFGLSPKLGPIIDWGLEIEKNAIKVDNTIDYQTNIPGIFAIGDINTYPGKLKLILCGFHEATLAVQAAYKIINPEKKFTLKYTTVQGIQGFD